MFNAQVTIGQILKAKKRDERGEAFQQIYDSVHVPLIVPLTFEVIATQGWRLQQEERTQGAMQELMRYRSNGQKRWSLGETRPPPGKSRKAKRTEKARAHTLLLFLLLKSTFPLTKAGTYNCDGCCGGGGERRGEGSHLSCFFAHACSVSRHNR